MNVISAPQPILEGCLYFMELEYRDLWRPGSHGRGVVAVVPSAVGIPLLTSGGFPFPSERGMGRTLPTHAQAKCEAGSDWEYLSDPQWEIRDQRHMWVFRPLGRRLQGARTSLARLALRDGRWAQTTQGSISGSCVFPDGESTLTADSGGEIRDCSQLGMEGGPCHMRGLLFPFSFLFFTLPLSL